MYNDTQQIFYDLHRRRGGFQETNPDNTDYLASFPSTSKEVDRGCQLISICKFDGAQSGSFPVVRPDTPTSPLQDPQTSAKSAAEHLPLSEHGILLLHFTLVLFPLLMMVAGIVDYGWMYHQKIVAAEAVRAGARAAVTINPDFEVDDGSGNLIGPNCNDVRSAAVRLSEEYWQEHIGVQQTGKFQASWEPSWTIDGAIFRPRRCRLRVVTTPAANADCIICMFTPGAALQASSSFRFESTRQFGGGFFTGNPVSCSCA
ncbi:MAG: pilus assembly protein [Bdellovibrionales bacterium]|nr:pilus assembly protein [Bdellovibrionales bacterium]